MASAMLDTSYLSASYSVPEATLQTLLDAPTVQLVESFLLQLSAKAQEYDNVKADKLKSDVQLEAAVRGGETRASQLKESVNVGLQQIEDLRRQLNEAENARVALDSELRELKSSSSSSTSEVQTLQSRLAVLEASNRDTVALLDSKSGAHDRLAEELSTQQQKIIGLRREVSELEEKLQRAENSSMSTKFREQNLQQEVDLLKKSNEWHEDELKRRTAEHTKFRKEKGARIAELQRSNEDATQSVEALRRTETTLRNRLEEVNQKAGDAFTRVQALEDDAAKAQETFRVELDSAHRLAELQKQSANTARARLQDVQGAYDQLKDDAAEEIGHLQAEAESERAEKELLEHKTSELEVQLEHREAEIAAARHTTSVPGTPRRGINGTNGTPGLVGSPGVFASPGGSRLKSGLSVTQLYSEHSQLRADLDKERRRSERLKSTLDEMIRDLEQKQPEIEELRTEHDRLQADVEELSSLLEEANKSREDARKETRKVEGHAAGLAQEGELLRQQLRDLSSQIKVLLLEAQAREEGLESLSPADQVQFELAARGELDDSNIDGVSDTGRLISRRLIIFRNAHELQEQNVKLLHLTRKLGEEMEGDEAKAKRVQEDKDKQDLEELRERVERHQDEMKSLILRSESYIRERDMFRRMLANRGQLPAGADPTAIFGQSINSSAFGASTGLQAGDASQDSRDLDDHRKLLKEMQSHFDAYRQEASTDHSALKEQMDRVSKEKVDLQGEIARTSSQLALARERYDLLQANMNMLKGENSELQKRSSYLAEVAAKQDLRTQHVAEDLVEVKSMADGLRNENANLKAERELWKNIESRLSEDNRQLMDERSRLNKMMSDLQSLQNERELTESETRRRLQSRAESLESELQSAKRKLDEEVEESKKAAMRREYDQDQNRTRVDDLLKGLSNTREDLVAAKTSRDILQARVEEMKIDLRNAEERAQAMQPRPTPRSTTTAPVNAGLTDQENQLTAEQELAVQAADLKRDLELARNELQQASEHVDQYKAISQSTEEELQSMNEIHDQYKNETDTLLSQKDARIQDLETRVEEISSELATTNTELSEVHARLEDTASQFAEQRAILNSEIVRLRDDSERFNETSKLHQADLKAQAEIAQRAQQSYEDELVKHAEAAKLLQKVRSEFNVVKTEVAGYKAEADAAKMTVQQNEESWAESRNRYEQELTELRNRREDVNSQNRRLHQQLETISAQIVTLKQSRSTFGQGEEQEITSFGPESNREEIITWLKNEKEIVEVQLELSAQEAKRYKQKLDHTETLLDETREKLNQERQSQTDRDQTTMSHNSLMESLSQLNLFRESNASLRNEARQAQSQLAERTKEVAELTSQLEPLRTRAREVENELENKEGEIKLLQEDRDRWQKRTQDILQKYDRVDPAELEALKTQITTLQTERDQLVLEKTTMQVQIDGVSDQIKQATDEVERVLGERRQKIVDQSKEKARKDKVIIQEKTQLLDAATVDNARVQSELVAVRDELQRTTAARDEALANRKSNTEEDEEGQINDVSQVSSETAALQSRILAADARASEEKARSATLEIENQSLQGRVQELQIQVTHLQQQLDATTIAVQSSTTGSIDAPDGETSSQITSLQAELASVKKELEETRAKITLGATQATIQVDGVQTMEYGDEQIAARRAELEKEYQEKATAAEQRFNLRANDMRSKLSAKLAEGRTKAQEDAQLAVEQLKIEHAAELERIKADHNQQLERLRNAVPQYTADGESATGTEIPPVLDVVAAISAMTEAEAKRVVANNDTIKTIMRRNISQFVTKEKELLQEQHAKDIGQKLEEAAKAAQLAQENAVNLEAKRQSVKFTMADNKAKTAIAKIEVVEKVAAATPQRPVGEVWAEAKLAKPPVKPVPLIPAAGHAAAQASQSQTGQTPSGPVTAKPQPFGQPSSAVPAANPFAAQPAAQNQAASNVSQPSAVSSLPAKPPPSTGIPQPGAGRGRSASGSGPPGGSAIPRGGSRIGRGRGGGQRGGNQQVQTSGFQRQAGPPTSGNSPGGGKGNLNPNAKQFVAGGTGLKRPSEAGQGGNVEKRPRGEQGGQP